MNFRSALLLVSGAALQPHAHACEPLRPGELLAKSPELSVAFQTSSQPVAVNTMFSVQARVCDASGREATGQLTVDAVMPAHGHGMNYAPPPVELDSGDASVDGLVFHMPGHWDLRFWLRANGKRSRVEAKIELSP